MVREYYASSETHALTELGTLCDGHPSLESIGDVRRRGSSGVARGRRQYLACATNRNRKLGLSLLTGGNREQRHRTSCHPTACGWRIMNRHPGRWPRPARCGSSRITSWREQPLVDVAPGSVWTERLRCASPR